jgi:hypothetical protein
MASTCPNCGRKLRWYDVKAECKNCGVSIPNFNWEERLKDDNVKAERQFQSFYKTLNMFAYSIWGTKLRIARLILSFLPAVGFILPWAYVKSDAQSFGFDLIGIFTSGNSLIDLLKSFFGNMSLFMDNMAFENYKGAVTYFSVSALFMLISLVFLVVSFFLILFTFKKPKNKSMFIFDILSIASAIVSVVLFNVGVSSAKTQIGVNLGNVPLYNVTGSVAWGFYVALALIVVALVMNIIVSKAPAKSDETLEEERLARKAVKEEKERQNAIKKEKAREEAEKKAAEEQAKAVELAKAKLAAKEAKKKK